MSALQLEHATVAFSPADWSIRSLELLTSVMSTPRPRAHERRSCFAVVTVVVAISMLLLLGSWYLLHGPKPAEVAASRIYIPPSRVWDVSTNKKVRKATEDTVHYDLSTDFGNAEWASVFPRGGGLVHLGAKDEPFTVSMFHELRCLDIIGHEVVARLRARSASPPAPLVEHCMGYIRQMILCRADTTLESAKASYGDHIVMKGVVHTCNDWSAVYAAAEANYDEYQQRLRAVRM